MCENEWGPVGECDVCGEQKPTRYSKDPYLAELATGEEELEAVESFYWCFDCFDARKRDV